MNKIYISKSGVITVNGKQRKLKDYKFKIGQEIELERTNGKVVSYRIIGLYKSGSLSTFGLLNVNNNTVGYTDESINAVISMYIACYD